MQVREATKGTKLNEIMMLFTIATILYLPPTFVTVRSKGPYIAWIDDRSVVSIG